MKDKLTSALANVLYVGVGATILTARATSNVATACIKEGKSFCTDVKDKYDEKKSNDNEYYNSKTGKFCDSLGVGVD